MCQKTQTNLKVYGKQQSVDLLLDAQHTNNVTRSNEQVKKYELLIHGLIDSVCYLADQELPFRGHDGSSILLNTGDFLEILDVLKNFCPLLENHMNSATVI